MKRFKLALKPTFFKISVSGSGGKLKEMTKLKKEQFIEQYGEAKVVFSYYYKYSFSFVGEFEGKKINISVGGNADDVYRFDVESNKEYQVKELEINYATVKEGETTIAELKTGW